MEGQEAAREVLPKRGLVYQVPVTLTLSILFESVIVDTTTGQAIIFIVILFQT